LTLILFDIDGTLTATNAVDTKCYAVAFEKTFGIPLPTTDWGVYEHCTDFAIAQEALQSQRGAPGTPEELAAYERAFVVELEKEFAANPEGFREIRGARAILEAIAARPEMRAAIASGGMRLSACYKLARIGVDAEAMPAGFANDGISREDIARCAVARADGQAGALNLDLVYVGDGPWDAKTAAAMNMRFIGITGDASRERLSALGVKTLLSDYRDQEAFWCAVAEATAPGIPREGLVT
jgi:beta-phosphoglucomutase-like phosphatase (HAD superfamily)